MNEIPLNVIELLNQLMPGFLTAWVIYGLTTYSKPGQFERIIQALIYSFIVKALTLTIRKIALFIGQYKSLGIWDTSNELFFSGVIAIILGLALSYLMRNDSFFKLARKIGVTSRTPYPSEWYGAFSIRPAKFIVLHLEGERRITGYPKEWPTEPNIGHFRLIEAAWIDGENVEIPLDGVESILIPSKYVELVEFLKPLGESHAPKAT